MILQLLFDEAEAGRLYTALQFAETFENQAGLGGKDTIRERISVLATKGFIKFVRDGAPFGLPTSRSKFGYLCVEGMTFPTGEETADPDTGEVVSVRIPVLPSTYKCPQSGAALPVENPLVGSSDAGDLVMHRLVVCADLRRFKLWQVAIWAVRSPTTSLPSKAAHRPDVSRTFKLGKPVTTTLLNALRCAAFQIWERDPRHGQPNLDFLEGFSMLMRSRSCGVKPTPSGWETHAEQVLPLPPPGGHARSPRPLHINEKDLHHEPMPVTHPQERAPFGPVIATRAAPCPDLGTTTAGRAWRAIVHSGTTTFRSDASMAAACGTCVSSAGSNNWPTTAVGWPRSISRRSGAISALTPPTSTAVSWRR